MTEAAIDARAAALASGKGHRDENFPVASVLLAAEHRAPIMAFYRFARRADDIADHSTASADEKLRGLAAMRRGLDELSRGDPSALALAEAMAARRLDPVHAHDLLSAFEQDVTVRRYADWDALIDYCTRSAMPVGRFVLDVHGEDRATWAFSDPLCAALQIINHLQDCAKDYRALDRVYLPENALAAAGARITDLAADRATPALRHVLAALARRTRELLDRSRPFARAIRSRRLAAEVSAIQALAEHLVGLLERRDPLSERVHLPKWRALLIGGGAALGRIAAR